MTTITINDKEIKAIDAALVGIGSLLDLIVAHKDDLKAFHDGKLMPVLWGRAFGAAEGIINQRGKLTAELFKVGQLIGANKAQIDGELLARVKATARVRASQLYNDAKIAHPYTKASAPKANKAHKGGASAPAKVKTAKVKTEKKMQSFETIKNASEFHKRLLDNRKITDLTFPANNYGLAAPKLAALLKKQYEELEALIATIKD